LDNLLLENFWNGGMGMFYAQVGENIRKYRLLKQMSMQELGDAINKSKAAIFKYEKGTSSIDIEVLLQIADALNIGYEQLLPPKALQSEPTEEDRRLIMALNGSFFYQYNGTKRGMIKGRFEVVSKENITLYYDYTDQNDYKKSRLIYWGHGHLEGNMVNLFLQNQKHNIEYCVCSARIPIVNANYVYGFILGLSPSTLMPILNKFLISKKPLANDENLLQILSFTKEELSLVKKNNTIALSLQQLSLFKPY